jgi:uncharacterized protein
MKYFEPDIARTKLGLAYGPSALAYFEAHPEGLDYIEVPFEQLCRTPEVSLLQEQIPMILHCASLSVAGTVPPCPETLQSVARVAEFMRSPWIGEHLAFISAGSLDCDRDDADPTLLTYTMCPQLSENTVDLVIDNLANARRSLGSMPLLLENSPQYFDIPGSTMQMSEFITTVLDRCDANLLLDLSHLLITCINTGANPHEELRKLPLGRVVEVHISGVSKQSGVAWDDHAAPAPSVVFELLEEVLTEVRPQALTVEYNWSPTFPQAILGSHLQRIRALLEVS